MLLLVLFVQIMHGWEVLFFVCLSVAGVAAAQNAGRVSVCLGSALTVLADISAFLICYD
jgi:hypothetical protein